MNILGIKKFVIYIKPTDNVEVLKTQIEEIGKIPINEQILIFYDKILKNDESISHYNVESNDIIICIKKINEKNMIFDDNKIEINKSEINKLLFSKIVELDNNLKTKDINYIKKELKLISVIFISEDENILQSFICKINDSFKILENEFYESYPAYKRTNNVFMVNGNLIDRNKTLEENKIKNSENIIIKREDEK